MARMYFDFKVNLPDTDNTAPVLDQVRFYNPTKDIVLYMESIRSVDSKLENGVYSGRFKGLRCMIEGEAADNHDWKELTEKDMELLKGMGVSGIVLDADDKAYKFPLKARNLNLEVKYDQKKKLVFHAEDPDVEVTCSSFHPIYIRNEKEVKVA